MCGCVCVSVLCVGVGVSVAVGVAVGVCNDPPGCPDPYPQNPGIRYVTQKRE